MSTPDQSTAEKQLNRVRWIARLNGGSIAGLAVLCLVISLVTGGSYAGITVCCLLVLSGLMEMKGAWMLVRRLPACRRWLIASQLLCFIAIAAYCGYQITYVDIAQSLAQIPPETLNLMSELYQLSQNELLDLLEVTVKLCYAVVAFVSFLYQGGLLLYYARKSKKLLSISKG